MINPNQRGLLAVPVVLTLAWPAFGQTFNGSSLSHRSTGSGSGSWTLSENGYVGTYFSLAQPGSVTLTVNAVGATNDAVLPHMNLVVADTKVGFDVGSELSNYQHTFNLPAGTYFVRTEFNNDMPIANRQLTVGSLTVSGATVSNTTSTTTNNANALAAADTYIENYRQGRAQLELIGVEPGTPVHAKLSRHSFRFGTAVGGFSQSGVNSYLYNSNYRNFLLDHFNTVTSGNAGKWAYNESTRDVVTMGGVDALLNFAQNNGLDVRLHNMLWGDSQQPAWAMTLLDNAAGGDQAAKDDLRAEISERVDYYVGDGDANPNDGDRASRYHEMDLINEHSHQPKYWDVYGADGVADIFNESAAAVAAANSNAKLYLNEYNVFNWGDSYGNWYRQDVEEIVNNGGTIGGIGIQYYPSAYTANPSGAHVPARIYQTMQALSVTGLDISLTEFGVSNSNGTTVEDAATYLEDTMRLVFGTPSATTFMMWGFWANDVWSAAPLAALMDANWNQTLPGVTYDALMSEWDTDVTLLVDPNGRIDFSGFYGDYEINVGGEVFGLELVKGIEDYALVVDLPGDFDDDLDVDNVDLGIWEAAYGVNANGDANDDGVGDGQDFLIWQRNYGLDYSPASAVAVPEPATGLLILVACVALKRIRPTASAV